MPVKRLHYYDQQFLREPDFTDEQTYHKEMRRMLSAKLHSYGVVEGLAVSKKAARTITVSPGMALDFKGQEIILEAPRDMTVPPTPNTIYIITIEYGETLTDPPPPEFKISDTDRTRFTEAPVLRGHKSTESSDPRFKIPLASVLTNSAGNILNVSNISARASVPTGTEIRRARGNYTSLDARLEAALDIDSDYPFKNIVWVESFVQRANDARSRQLVLVNRNLMGKLIRIRGYVEGGTSGGFVLIGDRNGFGSTRYRILNQLADEVWVQYTAHRGVGKSDPPYIPLFFCKRTVKGVVRTYRIELDFRNNRLACSVLGFMPPTTGTPPLGSVGGARVALEIAWR